MSTIIASLDHRSPAERSGVRPGKSSWLSMAIRSWMCWTTAFLVMTKTQSWNWLMKTGSAVWCVCTSRKERTWTEL